jgi:hypothetical protein
MKRLCVLALTPTALLCVLRGSGEGDLWPQGPQSHGDQHPVLIARQGSFMVGGTVITNPGAFDLNHPTPEGRRSTAITPTSSSPTPLIRFDERRSFPG